MTAQVPLGPDDRYCPFWRRKMSKVCHTCNLWIRVRGKDKNTGAEVDHWNCSLAWAPSMMVEIAQTQRETGAAIESFRNAVVSTPPVYVEVAGSHALPASAQPAISDGRTHER